MMVAACSRWLPFRWGYFQQCFHLIADVLFPAQQEYPELFFVFEKHTGKNFFGKEWKNEHAVQGEKEGADRNFF